MPSSLCLAVCIHLCLAPTAGIIGTGSREAHAGVVGQSGGPVGESRCPRVQTRGGRRFPASRECAQQVFFLDRFPFGFTRLAPIQTTLLSICCIKHLCRHEGGNARTHGDSVGAAWVPRPSAVVRAPSLSGWCCSRVPAAQVLSLCLPLPQVVAAASARGACSLPRIPTMGPLSTRPLRQEEMKSQV